MFPWWAISTLILDGHMVLEWDAATEGASWSVSIHEEAVLCSTKLCILMCCCIIAQSLVLFAASISTLSSVMFHNCGNVLNVHFFPFIFIHHLSVPLVHVCHHVWPKNVIWKVCWLISVVGLDSVFDNDEMFTSQLELDHFNTLSIELIASVAFCHICLGHYTTRRHTSVVVLISCHQYIVYEPHGRTQIAKPCRLELFV